MMSILFKSSTVGSGSSGIAIPDSLAAFSRRSMGGG